MTKDLAIVIPFFNSSKTLEKLLKSIINENDRIQIVVVDDKSDATEYALAERVINEMNKEYSVDIKLLKNDGVKSAGTCRNIGIEHTNSKWLLFADADDYFVKNWYLEFEKFVDSTFDIIFFTPTSIDLNTKQISDRHFDFVKLINDYLDDSEKNEVSLRTKFVVPWSKLFKSEFIKGRKIKFEEVIASNDVMFSVESGLQAEKISVSQNTLYCVTKNDASLTSKPDLEKLKARISVISRYNNLLSERMSKVDFYKQRIGEEI